MTPADLLGILSRRGFSLRVEANGASRAEWKLFVSPVSDLTEADRQHIRECRDGLFDLLTRDQEPEWPRGQAITVPEGKKLFWADSQGRPCPPSRAHQWGWEGGEHWHRLEHNPPAGAQGQSEEANERTTDA